MRIVFAFILLIGLGLAGGAVYLTMQRFQEYEVALNNAKRSATPNIETVKVAVAAKPLKFGQNLGKGDVKLIDWPKAAVPAGTFNDINALVGEDPENPRAVLRVMFEDEPILRAKVTNFGEDAGIRSRLDTGMRAFTIRVDVSTGVSGFLQPGDNVDIYWTGSVGEGTITRLILENVRIIAIDQMVDEDANRPRVARTITIEVSPRIVAQLTQAQQTGRLTLSLRGAEDVGTEGAFTVNTNDAIGREINQVEVRKVCTVTTRRGAETVVDEVPCPE
ncbi:MAG TPA: Flp pilus assembly protein CpaB [Paracoccaceae bacterium]|nr:Flp pilus assembly protein CpaB [Paracoccaceae bacterium]